MGRRGGGDPGRHEGGRQRERLADRESGRFEDRIDRAGEHQDGEPGYRDRVHERFERMDRRLERLEERLDRLERGGRGA